MGSWVGGRAFSQSEHSAPATAEIQPMRVGLITTLNTNIGDDFIREGICSVVRDLVPGPALEFVLINKHRPEMLYGPNHPLRLIRTMVKGGLRRREWARRASRVFRRVGSTAFDACDLIVQCGAPVYWEGCGHQTEWRQDLWEDVVARLHRRIPVLNLAAGSCYPYRRQPERFAPNDEAFARWLFGLCRATSVRDPLAHALLSRAGCQPELIPCSAFLFTSPEQARRDPDGPILINYMRGGGHYDWDKNIDAGIWDRTVREVIADLRRRHRVIMLCHNQAEKSLAAEIAPDLPQLLPANAREWAAVVRNAKTALCNRMHASVALAGMGIPSVTVGTDTRLLMVEQLGVPCHYVADTSGAALVRELEGTIDQRSAVAARLAQLQLTTRRAYAGLIGRFVTAEKSPAPRSPPLQAVA
ncbi:hypothetical protein DB347_24770 [Opitutaceae bacterium EW11]|nr:hypothetical protein DB347_24770 [Opitutaceae bacterium EW11]